MLHNKRSIQAGSPANSLMLDFVWNILVEPLEEASVDLMLELLYMRHGGEQLPWIKPFPWPCLGNQEFQELRKALLLKCGDVEDAVEMAMGTELLLPTLNPAQFRRFVDLVEDKCHRWPSLRIHALIFELSFIQLIARATIFCRCLDPHTRCSLDSRRFPWQPRGREKFAGFFSSPESLPHLELAQVLQGAYSPHDVKHILGGSLHDINHK
mmetsp:Transcript_21311/g.49487  ORF Transcript_21311/g.49487 Transcript_21311/m.49487 type:complete len:211 (-) Transcript_21311:23-655(-)